LRELQVEDLRYAHIFAFTYEGRYTMLHAPALFMVRGAGEAVTDGKGIVDPARIGLANLDGTIVFASDLQFWIYDRSDLTIRLDISSGSLQQLLIDAETGTHGRRIDLVGQEGSFSARLGQGTY
jgi:hypothetical protein